MTTTNKQTRCHFSTSFKKEAVALIIEQGYALGQAAQATGTSENNLRRWKKHLEQEQSGTRLQLSERPELDRLRRENKRLKMEQEILKKASAFFAKEMK